MRLYPPTGSEAYVRIIDETGRGRYFNPPAAGGEGSGVFLERTKIAFDGAEYRWLRLDGRTCRFDTAGKLTSIEDPAGNRLNLSYNGQGKPQTVTDAATGRTLTFHYDAGVNSYIQSVTGPKGSVPDYPWVRFGYDAASGSLLTSVTYGDGSGFKYEYADAALPDRLTGKRDGEDHLLNGWAYYPDERCKSSFSRSGKGVGIVYSSGQRAVTDGYGKVRTYVIEGVGGVKNRVTAITGDAPGNAPYASGGALRWAYDAQGYLTEIEYGGGRIDRYSGYDARGNPGTIILGAGLPLERAITAAYHPRMNRLLSRSEASVLGSGAKVTTWDYDLDPDDESPEPNESPTNLLYRFIETGYTKNTAGGTIPYTYKTVATTNEKGQVTTLDGPATANDVTTYTYDSQTHDLQTIVRPLIGATTFSSYDLAGLPGQVTDVNGQTEGLSFDGRGRLTKITHYSDSSESSLSFNLSGDLSRREDEDHVTHTYSYYADAPGDPFDPDDPNLSKNGRLNTIEDLSGNTIQHLYDAQGNLTRKNTRDPSSTVTKYVKWVYQDSNNNLTHPYPGLLWKEIQADGTYTRYGYDAAGNVTSVRDPNAHTTQYHYDAFNRVEEVIQPGDIVTHAGYDRHGNLTSVTDALTHTTTYAYDDLGRVVSTTSPDSGTTRASYKAFGKIFTKTDANGITVITNYDALYRLTRVTFPDYGSLSGYTLEYTYDQTAGGNFGKGRLTGISDPSGTTTFRYDARGRATSKTSTVGAVPSFTVSRELTDAGRVSGMTYPGGRTVTYERHDCPCRVDEIWTRTNGGEPTTIMENVSYLPFGGASGLDSGSGGTVANQFDQLGRLTFANPGAPMERRFTYFNNSQLQSITAPNTPWVNREYQYDALDRLSEGKSCRTSPADCTWTLQYLYDDAGNLQTKTRQDSTGTQNFAYTYVPGTNRLDTISLDGNITHTHTHDAAGNITGTGSRTLVHNQDNRLVKVEENGAPLGEYTYNALGQRTTKTANGATTLYVYDFNGNLITESDAQGNPATEYLYLGTSRLAMAQGEHQHHLLLPQQPNGHPRAHDRQPERPGHGSLGSLLQTLRRSHRPPRLHRGEQLQVPGTVLTTPRPGTTTTGTGTTIPRRGGI